MKSRGGDSITKGLCIVQSSTVDNTYGKCFPLSQVSFISVENLSSLYQKFHSLMWLFSKIYLGETSSCVEFE